MKAQKDAAHIIKVLKKGPKKLEAMTHYLDVLGAQLR